MDCVVLFPLCPAISAVQQMQIIGVCDANIRNIGTRIIADQNDEAMRLVFTDSEFRTQHGLTTINSINLGRIIFAIVHYFYCYLRVRSAGAPEEIVFSIPSGSFGNATAAWLSKQMGLPVSRLLIVNNRNDVTHRLLCTGTFRPAAVEASLAPAIDCQTPYNFDRIFSFLTDDIRPWMTELAARGEVTLPQDSLAKLRATFASDVCPDNFIQATMRDCWQRFRVLIDPHTAVAYFGALNYRAAHPSSRVIVLSTAHPHKFVDTVKEATGIAHVPLPHGLRFLKGVDLTNIVLDDWNVTVSPVSSIESVISTLRTVIEEQHQRRHSQ